MGRYADAFAQARDDREAFWLDAAEGVDWVVPVSYTHLSCRRAI